jgi:hypothetical protein
LAVAYVRPEGLVGMTPKSVKKKMKTPAFAAAVSREDMVAGAAALGVDFDEHLSIVIAALAERRAELMPAPDGPATASANGPASASANGPASASVSRPESGSPAPTPAPADAA